MAIGWKRGVGSETAGSADEVHQRINATTAMMIRPIMLLCIFSFACRSLGTLQHSAIHSAASKRCEEFQSCLGPAESFDKRRITGLSNALLTPTPSLDRSGIELSFCVLLLLS